MLNIKKENLPTIIFIAISFVAFLVLGCIYTGLSPRSESKIRTRENENADKYYLKEDFKSSDPYITKNPTLKDILAGPIISNNDPSQGDQSAPVAIVYFSDFECQFCHNEEDILKKIIKDYEGKVRIIWKDYPESDNQSISYESAIAGRCAQAQGKFWQYHDSLFAHSGEVEKDDFYKIAESLDLNMREFKKCYEERQTANLVDDNIKEADALQIYGIPFIYVNDQAVMGESGYEEVRGMVESEIKKNLDDIK